MKYYQVLPDFDGTQILKYSDRARFLVIDRELIGGELFTPAELGRLFTGAELRIFGRMVRDGVQVLRPVDIPKNKTYKMFGARFPAHELQEGGAENALY